MFPEVKFVLDCITIGTLKTGKEARKALEAAGRYVHHEPGHNISPFNSVTDMLEKVEFAQAEAKLEVSVVTSDILDMADDYTLDDLLAVAKEEGLIGLAEAGIAVAIDYKDQPAHDCIMVAMKPIADRYGNPWIFSIVVSGIGPMLWMHHVVPNQKWPKSTRWLFVHQ